MGRKIDALARETAEEMLDYLLAGTANLDSLKDEANTYISTPDYLVELEEYAEETDFSYYSRLTKEDVGKTIEGLMRDAVEEKVVEELGWFLYEWESFENELTEMQDVGWKFSRNGSDLIALDPSGEQHTREWSLSAIQELYDEVYLPSLDEEENLEDEDA